MAYNKTVVAGGLVVGVVLVAGILQLKFHFDPPQDNFTNNIDQLLNRQLQQMATALDEAPAALRQNPVVTAAPAVTTEPLYGSAQLKDLTPGIALAVLSEPVGVSLVTLRGEDLFLNQYDLHWQSRGVEQLLSSDVSLVNGQPPVAQLQPTADGYRLFISQPTAAGTVVNVLNIDAQFQVVTTSALATNPTLLTVVDDTLWSYTVDHQLQLFDIAQATLSAEPKLNSAPCSLMPDEEAAIAVAAQTDQLDFTKINTVGVLEPTVSASIAGITNCATSARQQQHLAIVTTDQILLLDDNLASLYPAIPLPPQALFSQVGFTGDQLWLVYSTSETLGEYQQHVATYDLLAAATQPDAADGYTN